jgi:prolyl 4-hydroxylase
VSDGDGQFIPATNPEARAASTVCLPPGSAELSDFEDRVARLICPAVSKVWGVELTRQNGTHAVRYEPGGFYAPHTDTGEDLLDRYFTVLCYLNDDFEGGETDFPGLGYRVAPRCGKAVVFPATYLHRAERVVSGEKYIMVSWLTGRPPIRWI